MRFTALLTLYQQQEDQARQLVGRLEQERGQLIQQVRALELEQAQAAVGVGLGDRERLLGFHLAMARRIEEGQRRVAHQDQRIAQARDLLREAHRKTSTVTKLRERDAIEERRQAERREQRRNDERAARRVLADGRG